jgi:hypothetical protein
MTDSLALQIAAFSRHLKLHNAWLNILIFNDLGLTNGLPYLSLPTPESGVNRQNLFFLIRRIENNENAKVSIV